jgi:hypothetical protein
MYLAGTNAMQKPIFYVSLGISYVDVVMIQFSSFV